MLQNQILLHNLDTVQLSELIGNIFDTKFKDFQNNQSIQPQTEDLMTRKEVLELLQIDPSTLFHWQNKGKIKVYKFANKCYYKRSELMNDLILLKK